MGKRALCALLGLLIIFTFCTARADATEYLLNYPYGKGELPTSIIAPDGEHMVRHYSVTAISVPIAYNKYGDHDPNGMMYVLSEDKDKIIKYAKKNSTVPNDMMQPLVIRANAGDVVVIDFYNELPTPASIHIAGAEYNVMNSDGAAAGFNKNTTTKDHIRYIWYAKEEGTYLFHDMSDTRSTQDAKNIHGLFGVLAVERPGSFWTDPVTGKYLKSGCHADIHHPTKPDFREFVTIFHDEPEMKDINGNNPVNHETGLEESTMAISYRAEAMRNRMSDEFGEEAAMSSWPHGDPATKILQTYKGDPVKIRLVNAGVKETHVFHMHNHQWYSDMNDKSSNIIDSVSFSSQEAKEIDLLFGAGSLTETIGDIIWHCHLYPHFNEGMWGLMRVNDRLDTGDRILPDGTKTQGLKPLPDRAAPPPADELHPGYPLFLQGISGEHAAKPPYGIIGSEAREATELEKANFVAGIPGNLYAKPAPEGASLKVFEISLIQMPLVYNNAGWHDPQGRLFVLKEDEEAVLKGLKKPEPLVIRANEGDEIEIRLTNKLPSTIGGNAFQLLTETTEAGFHIHLVKFDSICSDGSANGYNYDASARFNDTLIERFYADSELRTIFFHDHLSANVHQQHGVFGVLIVEPKGSTYHDVKTGKPINSGTKAIIKTPDEPDFREFVLAVHDFALLFDKNGNPLNAPAAPSSPDDPGVMGINYTCEPLQFRKGDPAYAFSSYVHGDPVTPLLEVYEGDPVRIRLFDGAHEEQHSFIMSGLRWHTEPNDKNSPVVNQQTLGISEAFNFHLDTNYKAGDYLYYFGGEDDLWLGLWGIFRTHDNKVAHLKPLEDRAAPPDTDIKENKTKKQCGKIPKAKLGELYDDKAKVKKIEICAIQKDIVYNEYGDHDPNGLLYVYKDQKDDVLSGKIKPEPIVIRANEGDIIEVTLTNCIKKPLRQTFHPSVPVNTCYRPSKRVSINAGMVLFDPANSGGVNVGYNPDQTVGPGESITYRWYADKELGTCMLTDMADIMNHRGHGLWGALIIEPKGSVYLDEESLKPISNKNAASAVIKSRGNMYREFVLFMQDGIGLYDKEGNIIPDPVEEDEGGEGVDFEDQGQKGFNYRSERFENRFENNSDPLQVFNSNIHGDPATPVLKAYTGENVTIRLLMTADKPRNNCFVLHGHKWKPQPNDPLSSKVWSQGAISVGGIYDIKFKANTYPGDYLYRSGAFRWSVEQGMWGILRIEDKKIDIKCIIAIFIIAVLLLIISIVMFINKAFCLCVIEKCKKNKRKCGKITGKIKDKIKKHRKK